MFKKFSVLIAAAAALVFAIPATAGASTGLTSPSGTLVPVGTTFIGTSTTVFTATATGVGQLTCNNVELRGKVTANSPSGVMGNSGGQVSTSSTCFRNGTAPISITNLTLQSLSSPSSQTTTAKVTASYVAHIGSLDCTFQLTNATATYVNNSDLLALREQPQTVTPDACGAGGKFDGTFTVETTARAAIFIMS